MPNDVVKTEGEQYSPISQSGVKNQGSGLWVEQNILLEIQEKLRQTFTELKEKTKDIKQINNIIIGVVIFAVVSFFVGILTIFIQNYQEKTLFIKYNDVIREYNNEKDILMMNKLNFEKELEKINYEIKLLKVKNPYLK